GLFVQSLKRIGDLQLGLDLNRVLAADFDGRRSGFPQQEVQRLNYELRDRLRPLPGVESVSLSVGVPFEGQFGLPIKIPGRDSLPGMQRAPVIYGVTFEYFRTTGTRIVA